MNFRTIGVREELVRALDEMGFETPMPVQAAALPELLRGHRDFIGLAQTGTGKTAAFGLPLIQAMDLGVARPQGVVLCPTRELCLQIADDLNRFARHLPGLRLAAVYGGASIADQRRQLKGGAQIVVATPGRLVDLIQRRAADLSRVAVCVLDEADEMLNMGFKDELDRILSGMPAGHRTWLFSATMPPAVETIARTYLHDPVKVAVGGGRRAAPNISHTCYVMHERNRYQGLLRILDFTPQMYGLIFCRTRQETQTVAASLAAAGYPADALHGDLSQAQRDAVMNRFRQRAIRLLVATDVAARGLDVAGITHIIHYQLPDDPDTYIHRSGRTARAGCSGASVALVTPRQVGRLRQMERSGAMRFEFAKFPDGPAIRAKQVEGFLDRMARTPVDRNVFADCLPAVREALADWDRDELIMRLLASGVDQRLSDDSRSESIDAAVKPPATGRPAWRSGGREPVSRPPTAGSRRFFINVGRLDHINAGAIVRLVCDHTGLRSSQIGRIELKREFSFFEVAHDAGHRVIKAMKHAKLDGRRVDVRDVRQPSGKGGAAASPRRR